MLIALIFSILYGAMVCWHVLRLPIRQSSKIVLLVLRTALLGFIVIAFFEPSLTIEQLRTPSTQIIVLVDQSQSMQLFVPESTVIPFLRVLKTYADTSKASRFNLHLYGFGDSLREVRQVEQLEFSDRSSNFPTSLPAVVIEPSTSVLIISDGNWNNAPPLHSMLQTKFSYYALLPTWRGRPFVEARIVECPTEVPLDSAKKVTLEIISYSSCSTTISISCSEKAVQLCQLNLQVDSGFHRNTVSLTIPSLRIGRRLLRFNIVNTRDTVEALCQAVQDVIPSYFYSRCYSTRPSLDRRFFSLAVHKARDWVLLNEHDNSKTNHALFIFSWDAKAKELIERSIPHSVIVFLGVLPCQSRQIYPSHTFSIVTGPDAYHYSLPQLPAFLPPPASLTSCSSIPFSSTSFLANAIVVNAKAKADTIPLLYLGRFMKKWAIALAAQGLWRWDFWPKGLSQPQQIPAFSDLLLELTKQRIIRNTTNYYYAYPYRFPIFEGDSLYIKHILPSQAEDAKTIWVRTSISSLNGKNVDTFTFRLSPTGSNIFSLPPLTVGKYSYTSKLYADETEYSYSDTLQVIKDFSEFTVKNMNSVLLEQISQPLSLANPSEAIQQLLRSENRDNLPVKTRQQIYFKQNILLLLILIIVLSLEWILRKKLDLD